MKTIFQISLLFMCTLTFAQEPMFNWVAGMGSKTKDRGDSIITDEIGNIYITGYFRDTVDFDPGTGVYNLVSSGSCDIFIQKLNPNGTLIWALSIGGSSADVGIDIKYDNNEYIYICGVFSDTVDFNPGTGSCFLYGSDHAESFVLKLDTSGTFVWAGAFLGSYISQPIEMQLDSACNVYTMGYFAGTIDFDPGPEVFELTADGTFNHWDIFLQKMDSTGDFLWAKRIGGPHEEFTGGFGLDQQANIILNGSFQETSDFDPGPGIYNLTSVGHRDIFVTKLNALGEFIWAFRLGSNHADEGKSLSIDSDGNIYSCGNFMDTVDFDPGSGVYNLIADCYYDTFIQKFTNDGSFIWAKAYCNNGLQKTALDQNGNIYSIGHFNGTVDFNPGPEVYELTTNGVWDVFIQKLDSSGNFAWTRSFGGKGFDQGRCVYVDNYEGVYSTGYFEDTVDFNNDYLNSVLISKGERDIFVLKLDSCVTTFSTINPIACNIYISPSGYYVWDSTGTYFDTIQNQLGCDSIITVNLTVINIDTTVSQNGICLTAIDTNCAYQWADCNSGYTLIIGDTNQSFTAKDNGSYAVILTNDICIDTSSCYDIYSVNNPFYKAKSEIIIYPVPATNAISIELGNYYLNASVKVSNLFGNTLFVKHIQNARIINIKLDQPAGIYLICLELDGRKYNRIIIKQ